MTFRVTVARALSSVMLVLLVLSIALNFREGTISLLPPLLAAATVAAISLLWILRKGTHATKILTLLNCTLMILGAFLFLKQGAPEGSSLYWFIVFPPMLMVCLGLRLGSIMFLLYYLFLFLILFTPLDLFLATPPPQPVRARFMLAMFGAFFFSWWAEYIRHKTYCKLVDAKDALERDALTDHLTGLANRRDFYSCLPRVMSGCRRKNKPYALAFLDIDHFKSINDVHGHQVGDYVLCHVAETIAEQTRGTDRLFRWGGEEFALLMPDCPPEQAFSVAERIRLHMEKTPYNYGSMPISVTVSIGLYCGNETLNPDLSVRVADENLYTAKESGRNTVIFTTIGQPQEDCTSCM